MKMTLAEIAEAAGAPPFEDDAVGNLVATGLTWDSREVAKGDVYLCLPGERVDGHDFAQAAAQAGAVAVVAARPLALDVPVVAVEDSVRALADIAACWRAKLAGVVIGLTGSSGKTTTKNLVRDVLGSAGSVVATKANQNNELGVPRTLLAAEQDTDFIVVEMGMRGTGQIAELCDIAKPDWGLVTNVGESHIELLGSREAIARAKAELLCALEPGGTAFFSAADELRWGMAEMAQLEERGVTSVLFDGSKGFSGIEVGALAAFEDGGPLVWADEVVLDDDGCPTFAMNSLGWPRGAAPHSVECSLSLRGMHNVSNACSAAAVGLAAGLTLEQCAAALAAAQPESGRQQVHHAPSGATIVDDSYNANPDSMGASLRTFAAMEAAGKRVAVLGDMLELGDFARDGHERMGALAAQLGIDELVCVGALSRSMAAAAVAAGSPASSVHTCDDAASALEIARGLVSSGDAVLVKASHSIGLAAVVEGLVI